MVTVSSQTAKEKEGRGGAELYQEGRNQLEQQ